MDKRQLLGPATMGIVKKLMAFARLFDGPHCLCFVIYYRPVRPYLELAQIPLLFLYK